MVKISNVMLPYSHVRKTLIYHQIRSLESIKYDVKVDKIVTKYGHVLRLACFIDVTSEIFSCTMVTIIKVPVGSARRKIKTTWCRLSIQDTQRNVIVHTASAVIGT